MPVPKASRNRSSRPLQLVHSDVCGPMNVNSIGGSKYVLSFTEALLGVLGIRYIYPKYFGYKVLLNTDFWV